MRHPFHQTILYEIGSRIFCKESQKSLSESLLTLEESSVFQASEQIWLMGVWEKSPASISIAQSHAGLREDYSKVVQDWTEADIWGSPYAIYRYEPNPDFTSWEDLKKAKAFLNSQGKKLILDFVPNHMSKDSPYLTERPGLFLEKGTEDRNDSQNWFRSELGKEFFHGRDPYFDGWTDTVQWDFSQPELLEYHLRILLRIADVCDGVRCDMAMLPLPEIFLRTHGKLAEPYWKPLIEKVKEKHPNFIFYAEAYWNLEYELQLLGFQGTYDKTLYDRLEEGFYLGVCEHLNADSEFQKKSIRFLENHDEPRAASTFGYRSRSYFALLCFLPGTLLFHEGQQFGLRLKLPVQLGRRPKELSDSILSESYQRAFAQLKSRTKPIFLCFPKTTSWNDKSPWVRGLDSEQKEILVWNPFSEFISGFIFLESCFPEITLPRELKNIITGEVFPIPDENRKKKEIYFGLEPGEAQWFTF